jgi:redox-sensitive bicupin YhaK (pirin superfamily)
MEGKATRRDVLMAGAALAATGSIAAGARSSAAETSAGKEALPATPTLRFRRAAERGLADHGWLSSRHTFSFASYYDPRWQGFQNLLVINDDRVVAGEGFPTHPPRDMEIISYVLEGALEHKDSIGTGSVIRPGDVQRMSAGTGVRHSEYNASRTEPVHFLQIWVKPRESGIKPGYEQKTFADDQKRGRLRVVASPDGRDESVTIHADAELHAGVFADHDRATFEVKPGRHAWIHIAKGTVRVGGERLEAGDAAYTSEPGSIAIEADGTGEVLVFDLA